MHITKEATDLSNSSVLCYIVPIPYFTYNEPVTYENTHSIAYKIT